MCGVGGRNSQEGERDASAAAEQGVEASQTMPGSLPGDRVGSSAR